MVHIAPHPELHPVFETLGYALGFGAYKYLRNRSGDVLGEQQRWSVIAAAMLGALIGSRTLGLLEQAPRTHSALTGSFGDRQLNPHPRDGESRPSSFAPFRTLPETFR